MITEDVKDAALKILGQYIVECAEYDHDVIRAEQPLDTRTLNDVVEDMTDSVVAELKGAVLDIRAEDTKQQVEF